MYTLYIIKPVKICIYVLKHIITDCGTYDKKRKQFQISEHFDEVLNPEPINDFKLIQFL